MDLNEEDLSFVQLSKSQHEKAHSIPELEQMLSMRKEIDSEFGLCNLDLLIQTHLENKGVDTTGEARRYNMDMISAHRSSFSKPSGKVTHS